MNYAPAVSQGLWMNGAEGGLWALLGGLDAVAGGFGFEGLDEFSVFLLKILAFGRVKM